MIDIFSLIDWIPGISKNTYRPDYFSPAPSSRTMKYKKRKPPYRIAFVNGYSQNVWRIQAIKSAKAWAFRPENKEYIEEFKVVSVGDNNSRLISMINNYIDEGFDGIIFISVNTLELFFKETFIKAEKKGTVLVCFDNLLQSNQLVQINENQFELGALKARTVMEALNWKAKNILMVNGLAGNSVDLDNRMGMLSVLEKVQNLSVLQIWGKWDDNVSKRETERLLRKIRGKLTFDGVVAQQGSCGVIEAMLDFYHPIVPMGVDASNKTRILMVENEIPGVSASQSPSMSAVALEALLALLEGNRLPRLIFLPIPHIKSSDLKDGVNYFTDLRNESFDTSLGYENGFKPFSVKELSSYDPDNLV